MSVPLVTSIPFVPGWRPTDEAEHPWLGSSDATALIAGDDANRAYLLYSLEGVDGDGYAIDVSLSLGGAPLPGWDRRPVAPQVFVPGEHGRPVLRRAELHESAGRRLVVSLAPERDLMPGDAWRWEDLDPAVRGGATDGADPFTFGHLFSQQVDVDMRLTRAGVTVGGAQTALAVCDARRCGSLYKRLIERLLAPDVARQAAAARVADPGPAYHPWYPVLLIGAEKAALYTRALVGDIVHKKRHLADPGWLVRVGLYLEFLTCLGVCEAVREDAGDLLTPAERAAFEHSEVFAALRERVAVEAWREVWALREIAFPRRGTPRTGPVSALNLLAKKKATLAFLHAHHQDLKHAIGLAGPNPHSAQETWQRVFRDAERAVLRKAAEAFPELAFLPEPARDIVLWHRRGHLGLDWSIRVPAAISLLIADQDGLFASACNQYRSSMNAVAVWGRKGGLMDYTGAECVPTEVSLLEARLDRPERVEELQRRDGYQGAPEVSVELPDELRERSATTVADLIAEQPVLAMLDADQRRMLAGTARPIVLGPTERLVVQGQKGTSLFVVAEGELEVVLRREGGADLAVDVIGRGGVVGEMSLLTGEPRSATVRAIGSAVVYEIGARQYGPLLRAHPEWVDLLARLMERRLRDRRERLAGHERERERESDRISRRIRRLFFTPDRTGDPT